MIVTEGVFVVKKTVSPLTDTPQHGVVPESPGAMTISAPTGSAFVPATPPVSDSPPAEAEITAYGTGVWNAPRAGTPSVKVIGAPVTSLVAYLK